MLRVPLNFILEIFTCDSRMVSMAGLDMYCDYIGPYTDLNKLDVFGTSDCSVYSCFVKSYSDNCVFFKRNNDKVVIITVYMDNLGIFESDGQTILNIKHLLTSNSTMKDLT